jgi:hypothetical protein
MMTAGPWRTAAGALPSSEGSCSRTEYVRWHYVEGEDPAYADEWTRRSPPPVR